MNNYYDTASMLINLLLGSGLLVTLLTVKSVRKKAGAEASKAAAESQADELSNVSGAISIWRELAQNMTDEYNRMSSRHEELSRSVNDLTAEVERLRNANDRILRMLDRVTHDNMEAIVGKIKQELM